METTVMMVRTPMMIPSRVRKVLSLFDQKELMAIATDSPNWSRANGFLSLFYFT
jgi:hypothetical protein